MFVVFIFRLTAQITFILKCLRPDFENGIETFSSQGSILLMGDFTSRTGKYSDCVSPDGNATTANDQSQFSFGLIRRNSFDNSSDMRPYRYNLCKPINYPHTGARDLTLGIT